MVSGSQKERSRTCNSPPAILTAATAVSETRTHKFASSTACTITCLTSCAQCRARSSRSQGGQGSRGRRGTFAEAALAVSTVVRPFAAPPRPGAAISGGTLRTYAFAAFPVRRYGRGATWVRTATTTTVLGLAAVAAVVVCRPAPTPFRTTVAKFGAQA